MEVKKETIQGNVFSAIKFKTEFLKVDYAEQ